MKHVHHKDRDPKNNDPGNLELRPLPEAESSPEEVVRLLRSIDNGIKALNDWLRRDVGERK